MAPLPCHIKRRSVNEAFTLAETMLAACALITLTALGIRSMFHFNEQRKLRQAAAELVGYLQIARGVANSANEPCSIALAQADGGVFEIDSTAETNSCQPGNIPPSLRLGALTGTRNLRAEVIPNSGSFPLTFNPEGTIKTNKGVTVLITSATTPLGGWCVDVQAPLAIVRTGWRNTGATTCNYLTEQ